MTKDDDRTPKPAATVDPEESRQAEISTGRYVHGRVRLMLIVSTIGVIVALVIAYLVF